MMGFAIVSSPSVLNKLALQTSYKAASGCKVLFGLVANRVGRAGAWWHRSAAPARNPPRCRCLLKPRAQSSIKKLRGCDGMHQIHTLLSAKSARRGSAHARGATMTRDRIKIPKLPRARSAKTGSGPNHLRLQGERMSSFKDFCDHGFVVRRTRRVDQRSRAGGSLPDGRWSRRQGRRRLRVTYGPYVIQNRKEGPHMSTKRALRADLDAEDRKGRPKANGVRHAGRHAW
jgi:hypothetical protein